MKLIFPYSCVLNPAHYWQCLNVITILVAVKCKQKGVCIHFFEETNATRVYLNQGWEKMYYLRAGHGLIIRNELNFTCKLRLTNLSFSCE